MDIREIFENLIKIEPKVMSIESLFNNPERVKNTDYQPSYQRNYVWDDEKATYFIESILLGTEIPPLIYFRNSSDIEVIDGRQRYQTILRFINNEFKLRRSGLQKLEDVDIANKYFKGLDDKLVELFWDTKLRIIEFSFHNRNLIADETEEIVKKEIFKRYNSGITPLKPTEIDKAAYFSDDLNTYIKQKLQDDKVLFKEISSLFHFEKTSTEIILKKVRQLLVQHLIPIKYYANKKDIAISRYYDLLVSNIDSDYIRSLYIDFIAKINKLKQIKKIIENKKITYNRLISECLYWAFSILEVETKSSFEDEDNFSAKKTGIQLITDSIISELVEYIQEHISAFILDRSSFSKELYNRYEITSTFFSEKFDIDFSIYLQTNNDFKQKNKEVSPNNKERTSFDELRINKPEPSSTAIVDIVRQMGRQRFLIRPPYQRNEVINKKKSSSIIESILLGIKLPPIFVFKRGDGISEVLDGQQRLLSILGFIQESYLDENNRERHSSKDGYSLNLKNGILKTLHTKKFKQLAVEDQEKIRNFDLWIIEINQKNNPNFEPIDLFIRLNSKPYPIKEDTFEMWNSYISRDVIDTIKSVHKKNKDWFYLRKNNSRMEDENIYTALAYLEYSVNKSGLDSIYISKDLDIYKVVNRINFRVKSKNEITKVLEDVDQKEKFINACNTIEFVFLKKLKELITDENDSSNSTINKNLDYIFNIDNGRRTQQSFYALWFFLYDISLEKVVTQKSKIRNSLKKLYNLITNIESKSEFDSKVLSFRNQYNSSDLDILDLKSKIRLGKYANLADITLSGLGISSTNLPSVSKTRDNYVYFKKAKFGNYLFKVEEQTNIGFDEKYVKDLYEARPKILIRRVIDFSDKLTTAYFDQRGIFNSDIICFMPVRFGFLPKFVLSVVSSRLVFYLIGKDISLTKNNPLGVLKLSDLKDIPIPIISNEKQILFSKVFTILLFLKEKNEMFLYFERLVDAMVYEIFLEKEVKKAGCEVLQYLIDLPIVDDKDYDKTYTNICNYYKKLSDPTHEINAAFLKLLNISDVVMIENNL